MKRYPYPENRVYLSAAIAVLSIILALALSSNQPIVIIYYLFSTVGFTIATFLLKRYIYALVSADGNEERTSEVEERTPWKALLLVLFISLALIGAPLLLTQVLGPTVWFVLLVGFTSGVSISEVVLYLQTRQ